MIARLRGIASVLDDGQAVVEAGGVGYEVQCPAGTLATLAAAGDAEVVLHVHTGVADDAIRLYGFRTRDELRLFRLLLGVERIGPRAALQILGRAEPPTLVRAIRDGDVGLIATVPGVGRKTAQRLILELRDRLDGLGALAATPGAPVPAGDGGGRPGAEDAVAGLTGLGYRESEARAAVSAALEEGEGGDGGALVTAALRRLGARG